MKCPTSIALAMFAAVPVLAQDTAPAAEATQAADPAIESIEIIGRRPDWSLKDFMLDFIGEIGDPASDSNGYARWRDNVCVSVHNLRHAETAQYIVDRISAVALELGLEPGEPDCRPNLSILFTGDGAALANAMVTTRRSAFRPYGGAGGTTQGLNALREFTTSEAPVRWWQITMPVDRLGEVAINTGMGAPMVWSPGSRISNSVSDELWTTYVIVDMTKLGNTSWVALADYLAMVSLAQIDPNGASAGFDSILNLFDGASSASSLTELDRTYLHALYRLNTRLKPAAQRGTLASTMVREQERLAEK